MNFVHNLIFININGKANELMSLASCSNWCDTISDQDKMFLLKKLCGICYIGEFSLFVKTALEINKGNWGNKK